jgi:acyl-CoA-dependent ceramide synthase
MLHQYSALEHQRLRDAVREATESNPLHKFVTISYHVEGTDQYGKGIKDITFVMFYMVFFTFFREFVMQVIIKPLAKIGGLKKTSKMKRFMEQAYSAVYYSISGPFGFYIMYQSDAWFFKTDAMYATYPDFTNEYLIKLFYLLQAAFWAQQSCIFVLQIEKPRKDYQELVVHHIVTILSIWLSYVFHFTKMGLPIYITMDVSDFFLAVSKILNYLDSGLVPFWFVLFVIAWVYLRHIVNIYILVSILTEFTTVGPYVLDFANQQYKSNIAQPIVFSLIFSLQILNLYWLFLILRIAYRLVVAGVAEDERSDDEDEDDETDERSDEDQDPLSKKTN